LPESIPVKIKADAVFSSACMPNGNTMSFGTVHYNSVNSDTASTYLYIEASVVFGSVEIKQ
jgi:hypothetical protein